MMPQPTYDKVRKEVERLAHIIDAPEYLLPTYGYSRDLAWPHVEIDNLGYFYYVIVERGEELRRIALGHMHDLMREVFFDITSSMASDYEAKHRIKGQDSRRLLFQTQLKLLNALDEKWAIQKQGDHERILDKYPYSP